MGSINFYRWIRLSVVALLAISVVTTACGDGKAKPRQRINKTNSKGQPIDPKTGKPLPRTNANEPAKPAPAAETEEQRRKKSDELKKREAAQNEIKGMIEQLTNHPVIQKDQLANGNYKLNSVATNLFVSDMSKPDNWLRAFTLQELSLDATRRPMLSEGQKASTGIMTNTTDSLRTFEVPMSFKVAKTDGYFRAERKDFQNFVLLSTQVRSTVSGGEIKIDIANTVTGGRNDASTTRASVAELLATPGLEDQKTKEVKYSGADSNKKTIDLRIHKVSETRVHLVFEITEGKDVLRNLVLIYDVEKAAAQETPAAAAPADPLRGSGTPPRPDDEAGVAASPTGAPPGPTGDEDER